MNKIQQLKNWWNRTKQTAKCTPGFTIAFWVLTSPDEWHHIAITHHYRTSTTKVYLNGKLTHTSRISATGLSMQELLDLTNKEPQENVEDNN